MSRSPNLEAALCLPDGRRYDIQAVQVLAGRVVVEVLRRESQEWLEFWVSRDAADSSDAALLCARSRIRAWLGENRQTRPQSRGDKAVVIEL